MLLSYGAWLLSSAFFLIEGMEVRDVLKTGCLGCYRFGIGLKLVDTGLAVCGVYIFDAFDTTSLGRHS